MSDYVFYALYAVLTIVGILAFLLARGAGRAADQKLGELETELKAVILRNPDAFEDSRHG